MKSLKQVISFLKSQKYRITKARKQIITILISSNQPLSIEDIFQILKKKIAADKSTIYREMNFLRKLGLVKEVHIDNKKTRFEFATGHSHHLVCHKCYRSQKIFSEKLENTLEIIEKEIQRESGFIQLNHSLELFGICQNCRSR